MSTGDTTGITPKPESFVYLPDPPEESKDGMVFDHLGKTGNAHFLELYMGSQKTTVHNSRRYISPVVNGDPTGLFAPDLFISFNADPQNFRDRNGYIISEQGKPRVFRLLDKGTDEGEGVVGFSSAAAEGGGDVGLLSHSEETDD